MAGGSQKLGTALCSLPAKTGGPRSYNGILSITQVSKEMNPPLEPSNRNTV